MVWGAIVGGVLGIGSSLLGGNASRRQQQQAREEARQAALTQWVYDVAEWQLANQVANQQWEWDMARVNQLREVELMKATDQANFANMLIRNAAANLAINQEALADRFVTEERLRGEQVGLEFMQAQDRGRTDFNFQTTQIAMDSMEQSRQFLNQVQLLENQSTAIINKYQEDAKDVMASLALDEARDNMAYQIQTIAAMEQDGRMSAITSGRQGGGATAQRLAINAAQAVGRTYAELDMKARSRDLKVALLNGAMRSEVSSEMGRIALQMEDQVARMAYTRDRAGRDTQFASDSFSREDRYQAEVMERLTIPTFGLSQRQYGRELASLQIQTEGAFYEASMPYRQAPFLDPLRPTPGLMPLYTEIGSVRGQSTWATVGTALAQGIASADSWHRADTGKGLFASIFGGK
jgi:hypothetical protein